MIPYKRLVSVAVLLLAAWGMAGQTSLGSAPRAAQRQANPTAPLSPELERALGWSGEDARLRVIVRMRPQLDFSHAPVAGIEPMDRASQQVAVVTALQQIASASQASLQSYLSQPSVASQVDEVQSFWIFNGLSLMASPAVVRDIASRADVESIGVDAWRQWIPFSAAAPVSNPANPAPGAAPLPDRPSA